MRVSEKDLSAAIERLNRNLNGKLQVKVVHQNGYINLFNESGSEGFSHGNTKSELYYQVQLCNKLIEVIQN